jgi:chlorobactene glucosyltransferase
MTMKRPFFSWSRLLLWSHAAGVILFYLVLWRRGNPRKQGRGGDIDNARRGRCIAPIDRIDTDSGVINAAATSSLPDHDKQDAALPFVSIIVPARNEARNIRRCVTSLLDQDYANLEVIVVDDGSTDGTASILTDIARRHPRGQHLRVERVDELPTGWAGKPHALHTGVQAARGGWLLFTDADTWHAPGALRFAMRQASREGADLLSLGSTQELPGFWNKVMMPLAYMGISMLYPIRAVNDPDSPIALANGQYILIRHAVYDTVGGYARPDLRATLLDDRDLARVVKGNGFRLRLDDGRGLLHVWMYQDLCDAWRGWRKNVYLGNRGGLPFFLLQLIGLPLVTIAPFILLLAGLFMPAHKGRNEVDLVAVVELVPLLAYRGWLDRAVGVPWYYAFTHPLGGAIFEGILAQSAWRVITSKGVDWRGRNYYGK